MTGEWPATEPGKGRPKFDNAGITLPDVHATFRRWLGDEYDTGALDAVLATAAVERMEGDPIWLLYIAGSGGGKTETVTSLAGLDRVLDVSKISSEGALLSASKGKEVAADATGGLLRELGDQGTLLVKDFTSILSMHSTNREGVLSALREVYDGSWVRAVGTDGGRSIHWEGRVVIIGGCTTAWDTASATVAVMGDRFLLVRSPDPSDAQREADARQAIRNLGSERRMREELRDAAHGLLREMDTKRVPVMTNDDLDLLVRAANIVTRARSSAEYSFKGDLEYAHDPERPTRFAKQLGQVWRGGCAIGMSREEAMALAMRVARDTCPPVRLEVLLALAQSGTGMTERELRAKVHRPRSTLHRTLETLGPSGMRLLSATPTGPGETSTLWWAIAEGLDVSSLSGNGSGSETVRANANASATPNSPTPDSGQATQPLTEEPF